MFGDVALLAVVGGKEAGKTRVVETLTGVLVKRGYKIGTVKHIPHEGFTLDTPEKDTWRHAMAGAKLVMSIAPEEIVTIRKLKLSGDQLKEAIRFVHKGEVDLVIVEGFRKQLMRSNAIPKVVVVGAEGAEKYVNKSKNVLAFVGSSSNATAEGIPSLRFEEAEKLADIVEEYLKSRIPSKGETLVEVDGEAIKMNQFVKVNLRKTVTSLLSGLNIDLKGDETVIITVSPSRK